VPAHDEGKLNLIVETYAFGSKDWSALGRKYRRRGLEEVEWLFGTDIVEFLDVVALGESISCGFVINSSSRTRRGCDTYA